MTVPVHEVDNTQKAIGYLLMFSSIPLLITGSFVGSSMFAIGVQMTIV